MKPQDGKLLINAVLTDSYDTQPAYDTVKRIRAAVKTVPGADALVGGSSAVNLDIQDASRHDRNLIIPLVLLVILIVLGVVLRALIAPILLIVTVVLSFAASLGVSALFFNHVFHFANADPAFPLFAFVFLVALGIDYNIFLMTRVREETLEHGTRQGVMRGLAVTGGVITSAGVVLAATFVVLGVLPIVFLAELGFTVAFGVLLDTIVVRSILVPALSHEIGKKIWWPSKLAAASAKRLILRQRRRVSSRVSTAPPASSRVDVVGGLAVLLGDGFDELGAAVAHADAVVGGVAGRQRAVGDQRLEQRPALLLGVVVHPVGVRHQRRAPSVIGRSCGPKESVVPPVCQQIEPADTPVSTTPACQADRMASSTPCSRHIASSPATLPPDTQMTSWASRCCGDVVDVRHGEQRQVRGVEPAQLGGVVEVVDGRRVVAHRGGQEADPGPASRRPRRARSRTR